MSTGSWLGYSVYGSIKQLNVDSHVAVMAAGIHVNFNACKNLIPMRKYPGQKTN